MQSILFKVCLFAIISISFISCSHTADIKTTNGSILEMDVSTIESVNIRGTEQWIYASGVSQDNPVILWLDGGPGGSEVGWVRKYLGPLHKHATVVCWDQRGTARSFGAVDDISEVTVNDYVDDVIALAEHLLETYAKESIYLVGHSWGSVIGVLAVQKRPELFAAYVGAGQHINSIENDTIGWNMIYDGAIAAGDRKIASKLEEIGKPPYLKMDESGNLVPDGESYYFLLSKLYRFSPKAPYDHRFNSLDMFLAPEHRLIDRINLLRGLKRGVTHIYPQLAFSDLEEEVDELQVPVYLINGRYDYTCVATISERWFTTLKAPEKELLWLEGSGHNGIYTEPDKVIDFFTHVVLQ